jgi:hypothetical protein
MTATFENGVVITTQRTHLPVISTARVKRTKVNSKTDERNWKQYHGVLALRIISHANSKGARETRRRRARSIY